MKSKIVLVASALVLIALLGITFWVSSRGYSSSTFSGSSFHAASEEDCREVYAKFEKFLISEGFNKTSSPSKMDSWSGVHSEDGERIWFSRPAGNDEQLYLYVNLDMTHIRTSIKWENRGFNHMARKNQSEALRFALKVDEWIAGIPKANELPDRFKRQKREWFEAELTQINRD